MKEMIIDGFTCPCCGRRTAYEGECSWCVNQCENGKHRPRRRPAFLLPNGPCDTDDALRDAE